MADITQTEPEIDPVFDELVQPELPEDDQWADEMVDDQPGVDDLTEDDDEDDVESNYEDDDEDQWWEEGGEPEDGESD